MSAPLRYKIIGLLFAGSAINFIDRVNISVAAPAMMLANGWQKDEFGLVFSAFLFGYGLMQIPAGLLADRRSARRLLALAFCGFSLFTALTPLGSHAIVWLLLIRFLVGACEASTFPAITSFNSRWFPPIEFGRAQTLSLAGGSVGQMIAYPLTAWIVLRASWQAAFYVSAALGLIWVAVWLWYSTDRPRNHPAIGPQELALIEGVGSSDAFQNISLRVLLTSAPVVCLAASAMCFGFVLWTFVFWFPTYLIEARGFSLAAVGAIGVAIQACGFLGTVTSGVVSDAILRRTLKPSIARPKFAGACVGASVVFLLGAAMTSSTVLCVGLFALFYFFLMAVHVAYLATPAALHPRQTASIFGVVNCCASLGAVCGPAIVGYVVAHVPNWQRSFEIVGAVGLVCAVLLFSVPVRRLDTLGVAPENSALRGT
jgi:ACS family glucarate transporter-like MFS transporter